MGRSCTVCNSEHRGEVDAALAAGMSESGTARKWGLGRDSVRRHRKHLALTLSGSRTLREAEAEEAGRADALLESVLRWKAKVVSALEGAPDAKAVASLVREGRETDRLLLELTGRLRSGGQVNVAVIQRSEEWGRIKAAIMRALAFEGELAARDVQARLDRELAAAEAV